MQRRTILILSLLLTAVASVPTIVLACSKEQYRQHVSTIGNCQIFPANNIWNYNIAHLPVHPNSANYIANIGMSNSLSANFGNGTWGIPYNIVPGTQPFVPIHFNRYGSESDPGPYPIPPNPLIEAGSDRHVLVVDSSTCKLYELWEGFRQPDGSWEAADGAIFDLNSNALRPKSWTSADAAGLPIFPGLVRYNEVAAGAIKHALRVVLNHPQHTYLWPARHTDGPSSDPNAAPEGLRLRLKASVNISSFSPHDQVILTALKQYGMFVADTDTGSTQLQISGAPDNRWGENDLANLRKIHASDFEAVDESALQVSPDSAQVRSIGTRVWNGLQWLAVRLGIFGAPLLPLPEVDSPKRPFKIIKPKYFAGSCSSVANGSATDTGSPSRAVEPLSPSSSSLFGRS